MEELKIEEIYSKSQEFQRQEIITEEYKAKEHCFVLIL